MIHVINIFCISYNFFSPISLAASLTLPETTYEQKVWREHAKIRNKNSKKIVKSLNIFKDSSSI